MVKSRSKRILSILLSAVVLLTMSGTGVFAADYDAPEMAAQEEGTTEEETVIDLAKAATIDEIQEQLYTGTPITPAVTVRVGDTVLVEGTDYTVEYQNNTNITKEGKEAFVIVTAIEGSGYTGTIKEMFDIVESIDDIPLTDADVEDIDDQLYAGGEEVKPVPVVTYDGKALTEGIDYEVSYSNNTEMTDEALVIITAIEGSGYTGFVTETFRIVEQLADLEKVKNLEAISGYLSIKLTWDKVEGADTYLIMRTDQKWGSKKQGAYWPRDLYGLSSYKKKWDTVSQHPYWYNHNPGTVNKYKKYTYKVYAARYVNGATEADTSKGQVKIGNQVYEVSQVKKIKKKCVSKLRITVKSKQTVSLTSTNGKKHYKVKAGEKIVTDGYGAGRYYFTKKGATFRIMNVRVYATNADYVKSTDYSKKEAEYFINNSRLKYAKPSKSKKKWFIWVSTYNQRVYAFKKSGGKWKLKRSWDCSSGDKNSPSPTGNKELWKKMRGYHNIKLWNCYSSLNALHGIKPIQYAGYNWNRYLGSIKSGGCIRNANKDATWVWKHCPIGTRILVY